MVSVTSTDSSPTGADDSSGWTPFKDVWWRSGTTHRTRAILLLGINVLLFAGVGCFAYWVRGGVLFAPAMDGYWDELAATFSPSAETSISLGNMLIAPISVQDVPMQIPIVGLLMAALIAIPILVSILYRWWSSIPFILVVGFLAVMPWLAIALAGSCVLASIRPFSMRLRFMSAVAGLVPIVVYLALAWHGSAELVMGRFDPIDRIKFVAPWVLAIVASTLLFAVVLIIAKLVDYRPGAITPLLALMFGLPVGLFEYHVGRDELYYRILETYHDAYFADVDANLGLTEATDRAWDRHPPPKPSWGQLLEIEKQKWQLRLASDLAPDQSDLVRHQVDLTRRCDWFLRSFPTSRYALNALYLKARALDTRVDPVEFREHGWIRFYDEFPSDASSEVWQFLLKNGPESPLATVALLRLAQQQARRGDVDRALAKLRALLAGFDARRGLASADEGRGVERGILDRDAPEASLHLPLARIFLQAHRLYDLLARNRDPLYNYEPITGPRRSEHGFGFGMLDLDPRHERYAANLRTLADRFPGAQVLDNIELEIAMAAPAHPAHGAGRDADHERRQPSRLELLLACVSDHPHGDAAPEALFRLAEAYRVEGRPGESRTVLDRLARGFPDSIWASQMLGIVRPMPSSEIVAGVE